MSGSDWTQTPNLALYKPIPGADDDQWGDRLNVNADVLDNSLLTTGGTMTGPLNLPNGTLAIPTLQFGTNDGTGISRTGDVLILGVQNTMNLALFASSAQFYGQLNMLNNRILQVADATAAGDALNQRTGDARYAPIGASAGVTSWNTRTGAVTLQGTDVTAALGYTPYNATNPSGYQTAAQVTTALAPYAPLNAPVFTGDARAVTPAAGDADTSLATTAFVQAAVAPALHDVGRNLIHNPLFNVAQRGAGPFTANNVYTLDRWTIAFVTDTVSWQSHAAADTDRSQIGDEAATTFFGNTFTGNAAAGAYNSITQWVEGVRRLSGKTVTISFWAGSGSGTPKLGVSLDQYFGTGGSPSATVNGTGQSVTLSTTWTRYSLTFTVPSTAGKTLGTSGGDCTGLNFWCSSGATNAARAGNVGVQSGAIYLWGVQLEIGSVATPLEKPDPRYDLSNCQRFYQAGGTAYVAGSAGAASVTVGVNYPFPVPMRATPTIVNTSVTGSVNIGSQAFTPGSTQLIATALSGAAGGFILQLGFTASADL